MEAHEYTTHIKSTDVKTGVVGSPADGLADLDVSSPPQFGGPERVWSPEHLFVASISACLMTTFRAIAANSGLDVLDYEDEAVGHLVKGDDRMFLFESVQLHPRVVIADPGQQERALRLLDKAERACLISRSVACEVVMEAKVEVGPTADVGEEPARAGAHQLGT